MSEGAIGGTRRPRQAPSPGMARGDALDGASRRAGGAAPRPADCARTPQEPQGRPSAPLGRPGGCGKSATKNAREGHALGAVCSRHRARWQMSSFGGFRWGRVKVGRGLGAPARGRRGGARGSARPGRPTGLRLAPTPGSLALDGLGGRGRTSRSEQRAIALHKWRVKTPIAAAVLPWP